MRLDGLEDRPATQLSGGQQQRVALARAVATEPKVLLMDEPLSNLDATLREQMRAELRPLFADLGLTVLYVTHDQAEALSVATRIGVMANGELLQVGAPEEVYERPARQMVMAFLGGSNFVTGAVTGRGEAETPLGTVRATALQDYPAGSSVVLAVRPEDVELVQAGADQRRQRPAWHGDEATVSRRGRAPGDPRPRGRAAGAHQSPHAGGGRRQYLGRLAAGPVESHARLSPGLVALSGPTSWASGSTERLPSCRPPGALRVSRTPRGSGGERCVTACCSV